MAIPDLKLEVVAACPVSWDDLAGDERVRHCDQCNLHVYNVAEMTAAETVALIESTEGRICGRLLKRPDGTVMTRDCNLVLRTARRGWGRLVGGVSAGLALLAAGAAALGLSRWTPATPQTCPPPPTVVEPPIMGEIMMPTPAPKFAPDFVRPIAMERMGRMALPQPDASRGQD